MSRAKSGVGDLPEPRIQIRSIVEAPGERRSRGRGMAGEQNLDRAKAYEAFLDGDAEGAMVDMSDDRMDPAW